MSNRNCKSKPGKGYCNYNDNNVDVKVSTKKTVFDSNLQMTNHYKRVKSAKRIVDTSPPKSYIIKKKLPEFNSRYSTPTRLSSNESIPARANSICDVQVCKTLYKAKPQAGRSSSVPPRPATRRNLNLVPQNYLKQTGNTQVKINNIEKKIPLKSTTPAVSKINSTKPGAPHQKIDKKKITVKNDTPIISISSSPKQYKKPAANINNKPINNSNNKAPIPTPRVYVTSPKPTMVKDYEYLQFSLRITEDIIRNDLYSPKEMRRVFNSHIEANRGRLNMQKMFLQIDHLCKELDIQNKSTRYRNKCCTTTDCQTDCGNYCSLDKQGININKTTYDSVTDQDRSNKDLLNKIFNGRVMTEQEINELSENDLQDVITLILNDQEEQEPSVDGEIISLQYGEDNEKIFIRNGSKPSFDLIHNNAEKFENRSEENFKLPSDLGSEESVNVVNKDIKHMANNVVLADNISDLLQKVTKKMSENIVKGNEEIINNELENIEENVCPKTPNNSLNNEEIDKENTLESQEPKLEDVHALNKGQTKSDSFSKEEINFSKIVYVEQYAGDGQQDYNKNNSNGSSKHSKEKIIKLNQKLSPNDQNKVYSDKQIEKNTVMSSPDKNKNIPLLLEENTDSSIKSNKESKEYWLPSQEKCSEQCPEKCSQENVQFLLPTMVNKLVESSSVHEVASQEKCCKTCLEQCPEKCSEENVLLSTVENKLVDSNSVHELASKEKCCKTCLEQCPEKCSEENVLLPIIENKLVDSSSIHELASREKCCQTCSEPCPEKCSGENVQFLLTTNKLVDSSSVLASQEKCCKTCSQQCPEACSEKKQQSNLQLLPGNQNITGNVIYVNDKKEQLSDNILILLEEQNAYEDLENIIDSEIVARNSTEDYIKELLKTSIYEYVDNGVFSSDAVDNKEENKDTNVYDIDSNKIETINSKFTPNKSEDKMEKEEIISSITKFILDRTFATVSSIPKSEKIQVEEKTDFISTVEKLVNDRTNNLYQYCIPERRISQLEYSSNTSLDELNKYETEYSKNYSKLPDASYKTSKRKSSKTDANTSEGEISKTSSASSFSRKISLGNLNRSEPDILQHLKKYESKTVEKNNNPLMPCLCDYELKILADRSYANYIPKFSKSRFYPTVSTQTSSTDFNYKGGFNDNLLSDGEVQNMTSDDKTDISESETFSR